MNKNIALIGAGQASLQLGFSLLKNNNRVTIFTDKNADRTLNGPILPMPVQFFPSYGHEIDLEIDYWRENTFTQLKGVNFVMLTPEGKRAFIINSMFPKNKNAHTIDLRLKYSTWMNEFIRRGGQIIVKSADTDLLEQCATGFDAVFVATGKVGLTSLFEKDPAVDKNPFSEPQRKIIMFYTYGCKLPVENEVFFNIMAGKGELIISQFLGRNMKQMFYIFIEAIPGSDLDIFDSSSTGQIELQKCKQFMADNYPEIHRYINSAELVDENEWMAAEITPTIRKPIAVLPSGKFVMGLADAVLLNDPIMAQGLNNASKMAYFISNKIEERGSKDLDMHWMQSVFNEYYEIARYNHLLSNSMLKGLEPFQQKLLGIAVQNEKVAMDFASGLGDASLLKWFFSEEGAEQYIAKLDTSSVVDG